MPKKLPFFPLYGGDWTKDPCVRKCSLATRAVWLELLLAMHEADRCGKLHGTPEEFAQIAGCTVAEFKLALCELTAKKTANVTIRNGSVTVINRRMAREFKVRKGNALRQKRHRESQESNAPSSISSSISRSIVDRQSDRVGVTGPEQIGEVRRRAAKVVKVIGKPAEKPDDRSIVLKSAMLSMRAPFSEDWLFDAAEGVARSKSRKRSVYGYFTTCLKNAAAPLGVVFARELARVVIPMQALDFDAPDGPGDRLCKVAEA